MRLTALLLCAPHWLAPYQDISSPLFYNNGPFDDKDNKHTFTGHWMVIMILLPMTMTKNDNGGFDKRKK
jgi:hypothetical protein